MGGRSEIIAEGAGVALEEGAKIAKGALAKLSEDASFGSFVQRFTGGALKDVGKASEATLDDIVSTRVHSTQMEDVLATGKITPTSLRDGHIGEDFLNKGSGVIMDGDKSVNVITRTADPERSRKEVGAYELWKNSAFDFKVPVTVDRGDGVLVQERIGKSLEERLTTLDGRNHPDYARMATHTVDDSPSFRALYDNNPNFREQLQQQVLFRHVLGDFDDHEANVTMSSLADKITLGAPDWGKALDSRTTPAAPLIDTLGGVSFSDATKAKLDHFAAFTRSSAGKELMSDLGYSTTEQSGILRRQSYYQQNPRFLKTE